MVVPEVEVPEVDVPEVDVPVVVPEVEVPELCLFMVRLSLCCSLSSVIFAI